MQADSVNRKLRGLGLAFGLYDRVRHVTQEDGKPGIITGVSIRPGFAVYHVSWSKEGGETGHYEGELELADPDAFYP